MAELRWDGNDFRNNQDSSGSVADNISRNGKLQQGYKHGSLTEGLVAYYPMEKGEGEILHDGTFNVLGNIRGADWITNSPVGNNSLDFDASNSEDVDLRRNYRYTEGGPWTICVHFYSREVTATRNFVSDNSENKTNNAPITRNLGYKNSKLTVYTGDGGSWVYGNTNLNNDQWYHALYRYNGDGTLTFYLDGEKDGTVSVQSDSSSYCDIGYLMSKNGQNYHDGYATEMRIYDRRLSEPEIKALYNLSQPSGVLKKEKDVPGQSEGGISRYKLNGTADDSWSNNHGTNNGANLTATGVHGQAAEFNGSSDKIETSTLAGYSGKMSLSAWINPSDLDSGSGVVYSYTGSGTYNLVLYMTSTNKIRAFRDTDTFAEYESQLVDNWHHVLATYDGSEIRLFVDGRLRDITAHSVDASSTEGYVIGGANTDNYYYKGLIDDVRLYNTALTPLQVEKLYHKGAYRISRDSTLY